MLRHHQTGEVGLFRYFAQAGGGEGGFIGRKLADGEAGEPAEGDVHGTHKEALPRMVGPEFADEPEAAGFEGGQDAGDESVEIRGRETVPEEVGDDGVVVGRG